LAVAQFANWRQVAVGRRLIIYAALRRKKPNHLLMQQSLDLAGRAIRLSSSTRVYWRTSATPSLKKKVQNGRLALPKVTVRLLKAPLQALDLTPRRQ